MSFGLVPAFLDLEVIEAIFDLDVGLHAALHMFEIPFGDLCLAFLQILGVTGGFLLK